MWVFQTSAIEGAGRLFDVDIFRYEWVNTGRKARIHDPRYGSKYEFPVYKVVVDGKAREFAAGEFSNGVYGFYIERK